MNKVQIRAWSGNDGWFLGADERLTFIRQFSKYGLAAKLTYLYAKLCYEHVLVEIKDKHE